MAKALEIGVTAYEALGAGVLTGKYTGKKDRPAHSRGPMGERYLMGRNPEIAEEVVKIAEEIGCTPAQVALNWVRQQPYGVMIPIFGARKMSQLEDNLGCLELKLDNDQLDRLNQISQIDLGFPHYFQNRDLVEQSRSQVELSHALDFMNRDFLKGWSSIFSSK